MTLGALFSLVAILSKTNAFTQVDGGRIFARRTAARSLSDTSCSSTSDDGGIRFLGRGDDAIIRPGSVLVSPSFEFDHFLMRSAIFVYAIGEDDQQDETIIRAVVIDHPTAFDIGEMSPTVTSRLANNTLFRGGYDGSDAVMLLHSAGGMDGSVETTGSEIGCSGIYEGGISSIQKQVDAGLIDPSQCKFFFNYMEFGLKQLDDMFRTVGVPDWDSWTSIEIPPEMVLSSEYARGQLWAKLRGIIKRQSGGTGEDSD
ncbi:hypothetical protein THAOC_01294 [Thalassiosira oceanica]|uniref:Uncharacterized protein n=1 Tax=Thalassiosira oceanica TaxID=159749 RepID=K0TDW8_THAOC|nr:hypothetical protein THAOC_01294 [Thalassiosira oceanica]|mmetsp:Transcript_5013/g.11318  ORF Transcript_5013/g.11318 Transcript_5013/m.11318 type:complete len:257 (+) Transcript_5013:61-831(+)|eukprot:EJK76913.1 hypothetical protein THAOC_01294 [Thalassiosira oceanica]